MNEHKVFDVVVTGAGLAEATSVLKSLTWDDMEYSTKELNNVELVDCLGNISMYYRASDGVYFFTTNGVQAND